MNRFSLFVFFFGSLYFLTSCSFNEPRLYSGYTLDEGMLEVTVSDGSYLFRAFNDRERKFLLHHQSGCFCDADSPVQGFQNFFFQIDRRFKRSVEVFPDFTSPFDTGVMGRAEYFSFKFKQLFQGCDI